MTPATQSDQELIHLILDGKTELFEQLMRANNAAMYKVGRSYNYNHQDTQDLMQEAYIDAFLNLNKFEYRSSFTTWLLRIMLNQCYRRTLKASEKNEMNNPIQDNALPVFTSEPKSAEQVLINSELNHVIQEALSKLPLDFRMVFSLREIAGLNVEETAKVLEITTSNVKVRLNRAKTLLRNEIEKTYSATELFEFNLIYCNAIVAKVMTQLLQQQA